MKGINAKTIAIFFVTIMLISIAVSVRPSMGQVYLPRGSHAATYAQINVALNPAGIGQTVTVNMYLAVPLLSCGNNVNTDRGMNYTLCITEFSVFLPSKVCRKPQHTSMITSRVKNSNYDIWLHWYFRF